MVKIDLMAMASMVLTVAIFAEEDGIDGVDGIDGLDDDGDWVDGLGGPLCDGCCGVEGRLGVDWEVQPKHNARAITAASETRLRECARTVRSSFIREL